MDTLLQLLVDLEEVTKSMPAVFTRALETLSTTPMFNSRDGRLKTFAANCFASQNHAAVSHLQGFLLMFIQHVPQKMRTVVALIKPIISRNKKSTEHFLYAILRRTTHFSTTDIENMEWDELPLVPSISELLDGPLEWDINLRPVKTEGPYDSAHDYIDTYFRLLRADCFDALKKGIADLLTGKLDPRDMNVYQDVNLAGVHITKNDSGLALGLKVAPVRKVHNWETSSSLMFGNLVCLSPSGTFRDALWATVMNRNLLKSHQIVMVELCPECNSISDSQVVMLLERMGGQTVMVESPTYYRAYQPVMKSLQNLDPEKLPFQEELVHVEEADQIPRYIDQYEGEATVNGRLIYSNVGQVDALAFVLTEGSIGKTTLDISQEGAIKQALMRRVAIIQGPPGTGKTFIGTKLMQLLLSMNCIPDRPILVLTYKNHALDEFLKSLLQAGINEIIRVGGRSQDPALQARNLNEVRKAPGKRMSQELFSTIQEYRSQIDSLKMEVEEAFEFLDKARTFSVTTVIEYLGSKQIESLLLGCKWSKTKIHSLKATYDGFEGSITKKEVAELLSTLNVPIGQYLVGSYQHSQMGKYLLLLLTTAVKLWSPKKDTITKVEAMFQSYVKRVPLLVNGKLNVSTSTEELQDEKDIEDMQKERLAATDVHQEAKKEVLLKELLLLKKEDDSKHRLFTITPQAVHLQPIQLLLNTDNVWALNHEDRVRLIQAMLLKQFEEASFDFQDSLTHYQKQCALKNELELQHRASITSEVKILGMTITGASIHHQLLKQVRPPIVVVEEAAEVLEPQLMAVLGSWVQQLILIGDHKQLQPPVDSWTLKKDYRFDLSMMERLINNNFHFSTLSMQNRMRPEFAKLLLDIYPNLQSNLARVGRNEKANCIQHSMFFWDHNHEEESERKKKMNSMAYKSTNLDTTPVSNRSHSNEEEAKRAVQLALFLIQVGYKPSQITILGAYQGQVVLIRHKIRQAKLDHKQLFATTDDDDQEDDDDVTSKEKDDEKRVEVHTIDMYQGDENDFVIVSLVRSNRSRTTGFLKLLNRRCVAQSRAKCGLYFIGNVDTVSSVDHWEKMIGSMRKQGLVGRAIPLHCPKHPEDTFIRALEADDIPIGKFCRFKCHHMMPCEEHRCNLLCQPAHTHEVCTRDVPFVHASCRHEDTRKCNVPESSLRCHKIIPFLHLKCRHPDTRKCYIPQSDIKCKESVEYSHPICGHPCNRVCYEPPESIVCRKEIPTPLPCGHYGTRLCYSDTPVANRCKEPCQKTLSCGHLCQRKCFQPCDDIGCKQCEILRKAKEERERKRRQEQLREEKKLIEKLYRNPQ